MIFLELSLNSFEGRGSNVTIAGQKQQDTLDQDPAYQPHGRLGENKTAHLLLATYHLTFDRCQIIKIVFQV